MALTREKLIKDLTEAGLISAEEVTKIESDSGSTGIEALLGQLVDLGKITEYQAEKFGTGNAGEIAFGDYVVIDELGRGGMGTVLKARHRRMEREVAIKVLPVSALESESAVARFYQEVKVAAQLTHPNIVHAYDAGEHQGFHYLVMEYVRGNDLAKVVSKDGAIDLGNAIDYIIQAATGLQYAHKKGVVHRDIKPSNLLLDDEGTIKILDMGLARIGQSGLNEKAQSMHLTTTGQVMGTVEYMAPEQAEDTRNADHRSDIYSLGCTLFRFVTGTAPYSRDTVVKTILAHREKAIPSLGRGGGAAYQKLDLIFQRMVAKEPDARYQDCQKLIDDLTEVKNLVAGTRDEQTIQFSKSTTAASVPPQVAPASDTALAKSSGFVSAPTSDPDGPTMMPGQLSSGTVATPSGIPGSGSDVKPPSSDLVVIENVVEVRPYQASSLVVWGVISLALSICAGFGGIPGVFVWVIANGKLKLMNDGQLEETERSRVVTAKVLAMIAVGIMALYTLATFIRMAFGG